MGALLVRGGRTVSPGSGTTTEADVLVRDGRIICLPPPSKRAGRDVRVIEARGLYVAPGFIDLQVNGGSGHDFLSATADDVRAVVRFFQRHGTTSMLPTLITSPLAQVECALEAISQARERSISGVHLEGPFISESHPGTHNPQHILDPDPALLQTMIDMSPTPIRLVTLAPERHGATELLASMPAEIAFALGHSAASYEEARDFVANGGRLFTHLFNAMRGFHHRDPGAVGAALDSEAMASLIADGVHAHPAAVRLVLRAKGAAGVCLVSDAISAAGMGDGRWQLGDVTVEVRDGVARRDADTLAGSVLTLERALANLSAWTGLSLPEALATVTRNPARLLGLDDHKGDLRPGYDADLVLFDEAFEVHATVVGGEVVYAREALD